MRNWQDKQILSVYHMLIRTHLFISNKHQMLEDKPLCNSRTMLLMSLGCCFHHCVYIYFLINIGLIIQKTNIAGIKSSDPEIRSYHFSNIAYSSVDLGSIGKDRVTPQPIIPTFESHNIRPDFIIKIQVIENILGHQSNFNSLRSQSPKPH